MALSVALATLRRGCTIALVLAGAATADTARGGGPATQPVRLAPAWSLEASAKVDWFDPAPAGATTLGLLAAGGVYSPAAVDAGVIPSKPAVGGRAMRRAQGATTDAGQGVLVVFDGESIHGLRHAAAPVVWTFRDGPPEADSHPGDPEFLPRWVDAAVVDQRVIAINSDGRIVLLDRRDGTVRGRAELGPLPVAALHTGGGRAAIVAKVRGQVWAARVEPERATLVGERVELGDRWPAWSALAGETLLAAESDRVRAFGQRGVHGEIRLSSARPASASLGVLDDSHLAVLGEEAVAVISVPACEVRSQTRLPGLRPDGAARLQFECGMIIVQTAEGTWLVRSDDGRLESRIDGDAALVHLSPQRIERVIVDEQSGSWLLERRSRARPEVAEMTWRLSAGEAALRAGRPAGVWVDDRIMIIAGRSVACFAIESARNE